jgi:hypothetical protein
MRVAPLSSINEDTQDVYLLKGGVTRKPSVNFLLEAFAICHCIIDNDALRQLIAQLIDGKVNAS